MDDMAPSERLCGFDVRAGIVNEICLGRIRDVCGAEGGVVVLPFGFAGEGGGVVPAVDQAVDLVFQVQNAQDAFGVLCGTSVSVSVDESEGRTGL